jgi:hypothetical protein
VDTPHCTGPSAYSSIYIVDGQRPHSFLSFSAFSLHRVLTPNMPHSTVQATHETRTDVLTAEVRLAPVEQIAPDATVSDLMSAEQECRIPTPAPVVVAEPHARYYFLSQQDRRSREVFLSCALQG